MPNAREAQHNDALWEVTSCIAAVERMSDLNAALPALGRRFEAQVMVYQLAVTGRPVVMCGGLGRVKTDPGAVLDDDPQRAYLSTLPAGPRAVALTRAVGLERVATSDAYQSVYSPNGADRLLAANLSRHAFDAPGCVGMLVGRRLDFSSDDELLLRRLVPLLSTCIDRARRLERLALAATSIASLIERRACHFIALVRSDGSFLWQSAGSKRILREATGGDAKLGSELQAAIVHAWECGTTSITGSLPNKRGGVAFEVQRLEVEKGEPVVLIELGAVPSCLWVRAEASTAFRTPVRPRPRET